MGKSQDIHERALADLRSKMQLEPFKGEDWLRGVATKQVLVAVTFELPDYLRKEIRLLSFDPARLFCAGVNFPAHSTVAVLEFENETHARGLFPELPQSFQNFSDWPFAQGVDLGELEFTNFIATPTGEYLLTSDEPSPIMQYLRHLVGELLGGLGGFELKVPDWQHSTFIRDHDPYSSEGGIEYWLSENRKQIAKQPVKVPITGIHVMNCWDFLSKGGTI